MDFSNFQHYCKVMVSKWLRENCEEHENTFSKDVYVVWYCKTLQNAKALLSADIPDGRYFEVTYNGDKEEFYLDSYKKEHNSTIYL